MGWTTTSGRPAPSECGRSSTSSPTRRRDTRRRGRWSSSTSKASSARASAGSDPEAPRRRPTRPPGTSKGCSPRSSGSIGGRPALQSPLPTADKKRRRRGRGPGAGSSTSPRRSVGVSRIGRRTYPGRFSVGSWKDVNAGEARNLRDQRIIDFDRLTVVRCVYPEGTDFPVHFHPQEQLTIVESGVLEFTIGGEAVRVREGETITIEPRIPHSTRAGNGAAPSHALHVFLKGRAPSGRTGTGARVRTAVRPMR
ncbi:MAG: cupin domain-containing protein [Candidatus Eisenbacteria bacterium]|nr:cupin domain-containing protein [Candidatus Latescibacterota bacterium]MBD3301849.1 cupin domain-containing protein [Candidatus Eisenbacteria bacterium]